MTRHTGWLLVLGALAISFGWPTATFAKETDGFFGGLQIGTLSVDVTDGVDPIQGTLGSFAFRGLFGVLILDLGYEKIKLLGSSTVSGVKKEIDYQSQGPFVTIGFRLPTTFSIGVKKQFNFANKWEETVTSTGAETDAAGHFKHSSTFAFVQLGSSFEIGYRKSDYTQLGSVMTTGRGIYIMWNISLDEIKVRSPQ